MAGRGEGPDFVESLARGLDVIACFDADHPVMTLTEVAAAAGLARPTARRLLLTLEELGFVRTVGVAFQLTPRVLTLGMAYIGALGLWEIARPHLEALVARTGESSSMAQLDGSDIVYIARVSVPKLIALRVEVGTRFPAYATSMGRVLLAALGPQALDGYLATAELSELTPKTITAPDALRTALSRVASQGYALVDQELEVGLRSIAVPVRARGRVVAALNVSMHASRGSSEAARRELLPPLRETAHAIESDLAVARG